LAQPPDLLFSKEHEWVRIDGDSATIGITDYAQNALGDIVYVELPKAGSTIQQFSNVGVVESVKAVSDLFTPMSGEVIEVNGGLENDPSAVNREPYAAGWLFKIRVANSDEAKSLLSAAEYEKLASA
jgi:glycine cleavage system H protein